MGSVCSIHWFVVTWPQQERSRHGVTLKVCGSVALRLLLFALPPRTNSITNSFETSYLICSLLTSGSFILELVGAFLTCQSTISTQLERCLIAIGKPST